VLVKPFQRLAHHLGVHFLTVKANHVVQDFVDQPHRVDLPGPDSLFGESQQISFLIYFLCKQAGGMEIGENYVAVQ